LSKQPHFFYSALQILVSSTMENLERFLTRFQMEDGPMDAPIDVLRDVTVVENEEDDELNAELLEILEVFPDINIAFALQLLEQENHDLEQVIDSLTDMNGVYPREDITETTSDSTPTTNRQDEEEAAITVPVYDFSSPTSFTPSPTYKVQSVSKLVYDFPFLDHRKANAILDASSSHYALAFDRICNTILAKVGTPLEPQAGRQFDEMLFDVLSDRNALKPDEAALLVDIVKIKTRKSFLFSLPLLLRSKASPRVTCPILAEELEYVKEKTQEWKATLEKRIAKRKRREIAMREGTTVTCSCCYDEFPIEDMVSCRNEGHLFCEECLARYVQSQIFGNGSLGVNQDNEVATEITCCQGDCSSGFSMWALRKALKDKVLQKYDEMQYQVTIEKAGLSERM
jgi:hypothetical protein